MDDQALRALEDARDMATELERSIYEMLDGQGKAIDLPLSPDAVAVRLSMLVSEVMGEHFPVEIQTMRDAG